MQLILPINAPTRKSNTRVRNIRSIKGEREGTGTELNLDMANVFLQTSIANIPIENLDLIDSWLRNKEITGAAGTKIIIYHVNVITTNYTHS